MRIDKRKQDNGDEEDTIWNDEEEDRGPGRDGGVYCDANSDRS